MKDNSNIMILLVYGMIWVATAIAISVGIYVTKSAMPLWAFIFPGCVNIHTK